MENDWQHFEVVVRRANEFSETPANVGEIHPFEERNVHRKLPKNCKKLFDDGHCSQATFEACKYVDNEIQRLSSDSKTGTGLMMSVFGGSPPKLKLNSLATQTDIDEQEGFKFLFAGTSMAIRNPRGHKHSLNDDPDTCLDHLTLISTLLRKLEAAGMILS